MVVKRMHGNREWVFVTVLALLGVAAQASCAPSSGSPASGEDDGVLKIALTAAPADVKCLEISVEGTRAVTRRFDLTTGANPVFKMEGLPLGIAQIAAAAFPDSCGATTGASIPRWTTDLGRVALADPSPSDETIAITVADINERGEILVTSTRTQRN
jgi:hypothetical protein